jgi:hypothetical protein
MPEKTDAPGPAAIPKVEFVRREDFSSVYSNNVQFESFATDLKIIFGEQSLEEGKSIVEQHTAVRITWLQAKLLAYFLNVQVAANEREHGKVSIPKALLPTITKLPETLAANPTAQAIIELINRMREEFIASLAA